MNISNGDLPAIRYLKKHHLTIMGLFLAAAGLPFLPSYCSPDTKATKPKENITSPRPEKITHVKIPLTETRKQQKIEEWRKEIQSCTKGGYLNRDQFVSSKTYYEIEPYLSKSIKRDLASPLYGYGDFNTHHISNKIVLKLHEELPNIAEQFE